MKSKTQNYNNLLDTKSEELMEHIFQDRMEYLGLMSSAVVYQMQIPLIIMRGKIESYLRHPERSPQQTLSDLSSECEQMLKLLEGMIFVAPKGRTIQLQRIDLKSTVEKLFVLFERSCTENAISLKAEVQKDLQVHTEPNRLRNILIALINNAIESFLEPNASKIKNILIYTKTDERGIHLVISDTGCGMSEESQQKLLTENFFSTKQARASSGLGLPMARKMAADLKIDFSFFSEESKGSSFNLIFPKNLYSLDSSSPSSSPPKP